MRAVPIAPGAAGGKPGLAAAGLASPGGLSLAARMTRAVASSIQPPGAYRADIDGLRALAVVLVVLDHAKVAGFGRGSLGVDIFFVISGFVITGVLRRDADAGHFSIRDFYLRRVRRIAPAFLVMLAAVLVVGLILELPSELESTADTALSGVALLANVTLWREGAGYFGARAQISPLMHTWSLSLEEQFYLVYPALFALGLRARRLFTPCVAAIAVISLALQWRFAAGEAGAVFYLAPFRIWEILLGCLAATEGWRWRPGWAAREVAAWLGVVLIAAALWSPSDLGAAALPEQLLACGGAALLILAGREPNLPRMLLAWPPVVFVGLISYSLYLWHWPLLAYANLLAPEGLAPALTALLVAASFGLAVLSWRFVERPLRAPGAGPLRWIAGFALPGAVAVAIAAIAVGAAGLPARAPARAVALSSYENYTNWPEFQLLYRGHCFASHTGSGDYDAARCLAPDAARKNVLLWGDSHAGDLAEPLAELAQADGANFMQATKAGCPPVVDIGGSPDCAGFNARIMAAISQDRPDVVVLSARWERDKRLGATIRALTGRGLAVMLVGPSPEFGGVVPAFLGRFYADAPRLAGIIAVVTSRQRFRVAARLQGQFASQPGVTYVSLLDDLCPGGRCELTAGPDAPLIWDGQHFTLPGARGVVSRDIAAPLQRLLAAAPGPAAPTSPAAHR
ncbi:MAG TPA: acyltransferase family protein [Caulobacteraceae bacterium]|nr:acyltransferase family protein [Caulobacteraceae bacterium]